MIVITSAINYKDIYIGLYHTVILCMDMFNTNHTTFSQYTYTLLLYRESIKLWLWDWILPKRLQFWDSILIYQQ